MNRFLVLLVLFIIAPFFSSHVFLQKGSTEEGGLEIYPESLEGKSSFLTSRIWDKLDKSNSIPKKEALEKAILGYLKVLDTHEIDKDKPLTLIDFSLPSTQERLWIFDINKTELLYQTYVSHGKNSGNRWARQFSNTHSSYMSSLGFYITAETYEGKHGYSLKLDGIEPGFNDQARPRAIVIHGAEYVEESFIQTYGRLGRSLGCPALPPDLTQPIIDLIKDKSCLFIYAEDQEYLSNSPILSQS
ncbi:murein L,D-transpeptidase catalytic domain family protein [Pleomorphovibrio marinus]|uniref:murein L,D-transpeptidase catalytic domain family protein n=1 Tax=Pleomorphovibrio marinus TaxID=2164132 RepID=UPI000E0BD00D|nr:murein L,D-transpeptidase catalytic domain family protein [Pleomorphovibrio marinus]